MTVATGNRSGACVPRSLLSSGSSDDPVVVIYGMADAVAALTAARAAGVRVRLQVPLALTASLGTDAARETIEQAGAAVPDVPPSDIDWTVECGNRPGLALAALRAGAKSVQVDAAADIRQRIADIAQKCGGRLAQRAPASATLDLADAVDARAACRTWLNRRLNQQASAPG